jgi:hypothetical protein
MRKHISFTIAAATLAQRAVTSAPKLSTDSLLKTSKKKKDIELTEEQLGKVSAGYKVNVEYKPQKPW